MFTKVLDIHSSNSTDDDNLRKIDSLAIKTELSLEKKSFCMHRPCSIRL